MFRRLSINYGLFVYLSDLLLTTTALFLASLARVYLPFGQALIYSYVRLHPLTYVMVVVIWGVLFTKLSVYSSRNTLRLMDEIRTLLSAVSTATLVSAGALYLSFREVPRLLFAYFFVLDLVILSVFRLLLWLALAFTDGRRHDASRVLIVGAGKVGQEMVQVLRASQWTGLDLVGYLDDDPEKIGQCYEGIPVLGSLREIVSVVETQAVDDVIFALPLRAHRRLEHLVRILAKRAVQVWVVPDLLDLAFYRATVEDFQGIPLVGLRSSALSAWQRAIKRAFDLITTALTLLVMGPVMALVALAVRLDSPGPVIFKQQRVGENGRLFWMYKFRSMVDGAEKHQREIQQITEDGKVIYKLREDPRVTRVGRILRCTSLDELPQLINVLKGEMSMVGPRPELPFLAEQYQDWQRQRLVVPPGITGWWQVHGRSDRPMHIYTEDDLYYVQNYSLFLDLRILWKTVWAVLQGRGAY